MTQVDLLELDAYRILYHPAYTSVIRAISFINIPVTGRPSKSTSSICDKLRRESARLSQLQDIAGCRLIVDDISSQNRVVNKLDVLLAKPRIVDRRLHPSNGYRAVHIVAVSAGRFVEVQVRTTLQHLWAEISEKLADTVDPDLKYGKGDEQYLSFLRVLSNEIRAVEDEEVARANYYSATAGLQISKRSKKKIKQMSLAYIERRKRVVEVLKRFKSM